MAHGVLLTPPKSRPVTVSRRILKRDISLEVTRNLKISSEALFAISSDSPEPRLEKGDNDLKSSS